MFGIGLPEMILILALALIIVGPDKLPDLARSMAKGVMELKKTAETLKKNLSEDGNPLKDLKSDLDDTARALNQNLLESNESAWRTRTPGEGVNAVPEKTSSGIIEAEFTDKSEPDASGSEALPPSDTAIGIASDTISDTTSEPAQAANPTPEKDSAPPPAC
ncbi:MAG: twin-arginine translocase TatA/TatE family subunit [Desulfobulbaceae bacterium]|nr:twin-arginine translocase TatA/TatE family subunit [Desulfobulbaceae bacterium]